jgi:PD-(D/E)XK endonuclease
VARRVYDSGVARSKSYSDDDLQHAVAVSRSWRGVLRELGLLATSASAMRSVRRNADRLGLDYRHFTGQRRWTDAQLEAAVAGSSSWREVGETLGLASDSSQATLRGHAARLNLDVSGLNRPGRPNGSQCPPMFVDLGHLPRAGSLLAAAWFALCGYAVSWPLEPVRYDLVVQRDGELLRVQVKTASVRAGDSWQVWLSTTGRMRATYDPEDIDLFFVIDGELSYYAIPVNVVGGLHAITLSGYQDFRVGSGSSSPGGNRKP